MNSVFSYQPPIQHLTRKLKQEAWWLFAPSPQQGIQLADGTLVMPSQGRDEEGKEFSTVMTSRDHGATWTVGTPAYRGGSECQAVPLGDGSLMLNMRNERERFRGHNERVVRALMRLSLVDCLTHPVMETLGAIGVVLAVWVGGYLVISGDLTPGGFVAFLGALGSLYQPIKRLSQVNNNVQQGMAGLTRIYQLLDMQPDVAEAPGATVLPTIQDRIILQHIPERMLRQLKRGEVLDV